MMEGYCDFLSDETMAAAVEAGAAAVATVAAGVDAWAEAVGARPKREDRILPDPALLESVRAAAGPALVAAYSAPLGKATLSAAVSAAKTDAAAAVGVVVAGAATPAAPAFVSQSDDESPPPSLPPSYATFSSAFKAVQSSIMRAAILDGAPRSDGRAVDEVRPIGSRAGLLPRAHGSALFTRGETQALAVATLGPTSDAQRVDGMTEEDVTRRFYLQYFFPPSSVGETGRMGGPGRREIGHGALAERALAPSVPPEADFPYTIRVESTITESNGSSSMASVCGGCLAMLDAGVPLKRPIAGVAMGLILEPGVDGSSSSPPRSVVLTDILGSEDALGDMDFKVAGDADGITAFQMDIKVKRMEKETNKKRDTRPDFTLPIFCSPLLFSHLFSPVFSLCVHTGRGHHPAHHPPGPGRGRPGPAPHPGHHGGVRPAAPPGPRPARAPHPAPDHPVRQSRCAHRPRRPHHPGRHGRDGVLLRPGVGLGGGPGGAVRRQPGRRGRGGGPGARPDVRPGPRRGVPKRARRVGGALWAHRRVHAGPDGAVPRVRAGARARAGRVLPGRPGGRHAAGGKQR